MPATGDWEGTVDGFPASLDLRYKPQYSSVYGLPPYGFEDLVLVEPDTCPIASYNHSEETIGDHFLTPLHAGGSFGLKTYQLRGGITGARSAKLSTTVKLPGSGGRSCKLKLAWKLHPAHRRAVKDGTWKLRFADGESESFNVSAGGRLATGIGFPSEIGNCGGPIGGVDLFIPPNGAATHRESSVTLSLQFKRRKADGTISLPAGGCANPHFTMSASLVKSSR